MIIGSSRSSVSYICPDIVFLILKLLPVKSLLHCRRVCKTWKQVIDSTSFMLDHLSLQTPRILLQRMRIHIFHGYKAESEYILPDPDNGGFYDTIRGPDGGYKIPCHAGCSVHGVFCFFYLYGDAKEMVLYNPSIRRQLRISVPENCLPGGLRDTYSYGFWMDPCTKEFKIVILSSSKRRIFLYAFRKKEWSESGAPLLKKTFFSPSSQVLVDRVAHWAAYSSPYRDGVNFIFYFDYVDHRFGTIDLPLDCRKLNMDMDYEHKTFVSISKWRGLLSIVCLPPDGDAYKVYVMLNGCWITRAQIRHCLSIAQVIHVGDLGSSKVLASLNSGEGELALYDPEHKHQSSGEFRDSAPGKYMLLTCSYLGCIPPCIPVIPKNIYENISEEELALYDPLMFLITTASDFVESLVFPDETW